MAVKAKPPAPKRHDAFEIAQQSRLEIALERPVWLAIKSACEQAMIRPQERWAFVPAFLGRLESALGSKPPSINEPGNLGNWLNPKAIPVEGRICNWAGLIELVLTFGDEVARSGAAIIIPAVSQALFGSNKNDESEGTG